MNDAVPPDSLSTANPARPTPPISVGAARAAIASRLASLGYAPDLLDEAAVQMLILRAAGSHRKLRASLDTTLFLASAEHATRIDAGFVRRALQGMAPSAAGASTRPGAAARLRRFGWPVLAVVMGGLALLAWLPRHAPPVSPPVPTTHTAPAVSSAVTTPHPVVPPPPPAPPAAVPTPPKPPPTSVAMPAVRPPPNLPSAPQPTVPVAQPAASPTLPPLAPAIVVDQPALPPRVAATPTVVIFYGAGDRSVGTRLASLARRLRQVGVAEVDTHPAVPGATGRVVSFFFDADRVLAQRVTGVLATEGWPNLPGGELPPGLVRRHPGLATVRRGMVELQLP